MGSTAEMTKTHSRIISVSGWQLVLVRLIVLCFEPCVSQAYTTDNFTHIGCVNVCRCIKVLKWSSPKDRRLLLAYRHQGSCPWLWTPLLWVCGHNTAKYKHMAKFLWLRKRKEKERACNTTIPSRAQQKWPWVLTRSPLKKYQTGTKPLIHGSKGQWRSKLGTKKGRQWERQNTRMSKGTEPRKAETRLGDGSVHSMLTQTSMEPEFDSQNL